MACAKNYKLCQHLLKAEKKLWPLFSGHGVYVNSLYENRRLNDYYLLDVLLAPQERMTMPTAVDVTSATG